MSAANDFATLRREAEAQGFRVQRTNNGHYQLYAPNKHDIITCSASADPRALKNFRAELQRAGFRDPHATTSLGEVLEAALTPPLSAREIVLELLTANPDGLSHELLTDRIRLRRPDLADARSSVHAALQALRTAGEIEPAGTERGRWRVVKRPPDVEAAAPPPSGSGDAGVDADLLALDTALTTLSDVNEAMRQQFDRALSAFASMETVVRRNREILLETVKLKQLLNSIGSK